MTLALTALVSLANTRYRVPVAIIDCEIAKLYAPEVEAETALVKLGITLSTTSVTGVLVAYGVTPSP